MLTARHHDVVQGGPDSISHEVFAEATNDPQCLHRTSGAASGSPGRRLRPGSI